MAIQAKDITNFLGLTNTAGRTPIPPTRNPNSVADITTDRRVLFEWTTTTRNPLLANKKTSAKQNRSTILIGVAVGFLFILMQQFLLIAVVASLIFLKYVLESTPGLPIKHRILNRGMEYGGEFYSWEELKHFYFAVEDNDHILCVDTINRFPSRLFFTIEPAKRDYLQNLLETYIAYIPEAPKMFGDNLYKAAADKISLTKSEK